MSLTFPSIEWARALAEAVNRHPDLTRALSGLGPDLAAVVENDAAFPRTLAVHGRQEQGRITGLRLLADVDDILELEPAYVVRAPYRTWKEVLRGGDPVKAAVSGRVRVEGDLEALVRRVGYAYIVHEALRGLGTRFADEGG